MLQVSPYAEKLALEKLTQYLESGVFKRRVVKTEKMTEFFDSEGMLESSKKENFEVSTIDYAGCPDWVLKEIVSSLNLETATKFLVSRGYQVVDPRKTETESTEFKGLSDLAVNDLLTKLLGIE